MLTQNVLDGQMKTIEDNILAAEQNQNLSDTQRALTMQTLMNAWSVIVNIRTGITKAVFDCLTNIVRSTA